MKEDPPKEEDEGANESLDLAASPLLLLPKVLRAPGGKPVILLAAPLANILVEPPDPGSNVLPLPLELAPGAMDNLEEVTGGFISPLLTLLAVEKELMLLL